MVLTQPDIDAESTNLVLTSGVFLSHEDVASHTINPTDTSSDLESLGFLDGYENTFQDLSRPLSFTVLADIYRWDTPSSAEAFIRTEVVDSRRLNGSELLEGVAFTEFEELTPPDVGTNAVASLHTLKIEAFDSETTITTVLWQRENIVASIRMKTSSDAGTEDIIERLASRMDERIDGVLSGQIPLVSVPTPQPAPVSDPAQEQMLAAMLLKLGDLPEGASIRQEGSLEVSGSYGSYQRRFMSQGAIIEFADSKITEVQTTVGLFDSVETARVPVDVLRSMGAERAGQLISQGFAGATTETISVDLLDFPTIGDDSFSLLLHMKTAVTDLEGHLVYFVRGSVRAQFVVFGLSGEFSLSDTIPLAQLFDQRIQSNTP
jgi:hypothetical protein